MGGRVFTPRRLAIVGVSVLSLAGCLGLAWWQWTRFESASGTWQNLGYVLQWPLFGLFPAFLFWRLRRLRAQHEGQAEAPTQAEPDTAAGVPPTPRMVTGQDDDDPELAAYNRFLAQLNARDRQEAP